MLPKNNRKVTAEEALEQCRRNRQEARILEGRDRPENAIVSEASGAIHPIDFIVAGSATL